VLGESQLNVYIQAKDLPPRTKERLQAQVQTALRSLPGWAFALLTKRIEALGAANLPLVIAPRAEDDERPQTMSLGHIDNRPAARLMPRIEDGGVDWGQDLRYLMAKALAYMAAPDAEDTAFWERWTLAVNEDGVRDRAGDAGDAWKNATDIALLLEMFAAYITRSDSRGWDKTPRVKAFLEAWKELGTGK
jgi:hypothetical protein